MHHRQGIPHGVVIPLTQIGTPRRLRCRCARLALGLREISCQLSAVSGQLFVGGGACGEGAMAVCMMAKSYGSDQN